MDTPPFVLHGALIVSNSVLLGPEPGQFRDGGKGWTLLSPSSPPEEDTMLSDLGGRDSTTDKKVS